MTTTQAPKTSAPIAGTESSPPDWVRGEDMVAVAKHLPGRRAGVVAQAPGRVDLIGGIAARTGALSLAVPIKRRVCVAVEPRSDDTVSVVSVHAGGDNGRPPEVVPLARLAGYLAERDVHNQEDQVDAARRSVLVTLAAMQSCGVLPRDANGLSVAISCDLGPLSDVACSAARAAATCTAVCAAIGRPLDLPTGVAVCRSVPRAFDGRAVSIAEAIGALYASLDDVLQIGCQPGEVLGSIPLPPGVAVSGIDCGARSSEASVKHARVQTAAMMGRTLIHRILEHEGQQSHAWEGYLARLTANDFVERFRDRMPTKLAGADYLDRFGDLTDVGLSVEPDTIYRVRSRTEHHIYEHMRARKMAECLARGQRKGLKGPFAEAGELMYASHWSYGQRCGLGGVESERLVSMIRKIGGPAGVFGAKITGRGCGGCVAVLYETTPHAEDTLAQILVDYEKETGCKPTMLHGSAPGALIGGAVSASEVA